MKGFCKTCYYKEWKRQTYGVCEVEGCQEPARESGLCTKHNKRRAGRIVNRSTPEKLARDAYKNASSVSARMYWRKELEALER